MFSGNDEYHLVSLIPKDTQGGTCLLGWLQQELERWFVEQWYDWGMWMDEQMEVAKKIEGEMIEENPHEFSKDAFERRKRKRLIHIGIHQHISLPFDKNASQSSNKKQFKWMGQIEVPRKTSFEINKKKY